jgi:hypothetical protein
MRSLTRTGPKTTQPLWTNDYLRPEALLPYPAKLDAAQFNDQAAVQVTASGAAAIGAVAIPVTALSGPVPGGAMLDFGGGKLAVVTGVGALAGAVSVPVRALAVALVGGESAYYNTTPGKYIPSGTILGRTYAERDAGTPYGPAADADDEVYILAFDVQDATNINDCELARPNLAVKENFLPGWAAQSATVKGKVRAAYRCFIGEA